MTRIAQLIHNLTLREYRWFLISSTVFILSLVGFVLFSFYIGTESAPISGGVYREALVGQPTTIIPVLNPETEIDRDLAELLYADLFELGTSSSDATAKVWTVKLNDGLVWSDGAPLTADDVLFTLESISDLENLSPLYGTWQGVSALRINDREIRFTLRTPYVFFEENLRHLKIIPKHIFGSIPATNFRLSQYNLEPVGSGPFVFRSRTIGRDGFIDEYVLGANTEFALGQPLIDEFRLRFFSSPEEALSAFSRKSVDGFGGVSHSDIAGLTLSYQTISLPTPRYYAVFFNPSVSTALKERDVRKALSIALDIPHITKKVLGEMGEMAHGPLLPFIEGYNSSLSASSSAPSLTEAGELLDAAGWKLGSDGIRAKTVNRQISKLTLTLTVPSIPFLIATAEELKEAWEKLGVAITLSPLSSADVQTLAIKPRNYQLLLFGNILNNTPDIFSFWHSSQRFFPGQNLSIYSNPTVDTLLSRVRGEMNTELREQALAELQGIILADAPAIFLFSPKYLYLLPKQIGGLTSVPLISPSDRFSSVHEWYLNTARVFK